MLVLYYLKFEGYIMEYLNLLDKINTSFRYKILLVSKHFLFLENMEDSNLFLSYFTNEKKIKLVINYKNNDYAFYFSKQKNKNHDVFYEDKKIDHKNIIFSAFTLDKILLINKVIEKNKLSRKDLELNVLDFQQLDEYIQSFDMLSLTRDLCTMY